MVQQVLVLATKPDDLNSISRTQIVGKRTITTSSPLTYTQTQTRNPVILKRKKLQISKMTICEIKIFLKNIDAMFTYMFICSQPSKKNICPMPRHKCITRGRHYPEDAGTCRIPFPAEVKANLDYI